MKKIFYLLLAPLLMVSLYSCGGDDDEDTKDDVMSSFTIQAFFTESGSTSEVVDGSSKVYIFKGNLTASNYEYNIGGRFYNTSNSNWVENTASYTISKYGEVDIEVDYDCTIVVESNHYLNKYQVKYKPLTNKDKTEKFVFTAE